MLLYIKFKGFDTKEFLSLKQEILQRYKCERPYMAAKLKIFVTVLTPNWC